MFRKERMNLRNSWRRQRELQEEYANEEVPSLDEMDRMVQNMHCGKTNQVFQTLRARALFCAYYLTACRKTELLVANRSDFKTEYIDGKQVLLVRTLNKKNKKRKTKRQPIPIEKEYVLYKHLRNYLNSLEEDERVFDFKGQRATQIINEVTGWNVHFIRHIRLTHLVTLYDFNEQNLVRFAGWTDSRPAKHYMELSPKDLFREFYKR